MSDPFSAYKHADFSSHPVSKPRPPPAVPSRPQSANAPSSSNQRNPHSAHPFNPSSPTNRSRSHSHPAPPASTPPPPKPYTRVEHPPRILLTGHLFKQVSTLLFHSYHTRYLLLTPDALWWYATQTDFDERREPRKRVQLDKASYVMDDGASGCKLQLVTGGKTYVFKAADHGEQVTWKEAIERSLNGLKSASAYNLPPEKKGGMSVRVG